MRLSVCIATLPERAESLGRLRRCLGTHPDVEVLTDDRPRGTVSIGAKRQAILERATGDYVVSIDDDDAVPMDYIDTILGALDGNPDCIGHYELVEWTGRPPRIAIWTNRAQSWMEGPSARRFGADFVRMPFHKTPIRREHALAIGFKDMGFGEDHDFSKRLKQSRLIKTEAFIPRVLYFYRYDATPKSYA